MGNFCQQNTVQKDEFKTYCTIVAGSDYKPFISKVAIAKVNPEATHNYSIEGNWQRGRQQTGKGVIFAPEKFYYEGPIVDGKANGSGTILWPNRFKYIGNVQNNKASGQGQLQIEQKSLAIAGIWQDGLPKLNHKFSMKRGENQGSIIFMSQNEQMRQEAYFKLDKIQVMADLGTGISYEGSLLKKRDHYEITGNGTLSFGDGSYYSGDLEAGKMHGNGKYFWADKGHWYDGFYQHNLRDGIGRYYYNQNDYDLGCWTHGKLISKTAETFRKEGENLIRSAYVPKVEELSQIRQQEPKQEPKQRQEPQQERREKWRQQARQEPQQERGEESRNAEYKPQGENRQSPYIETSPGNMPQQAN